MARRPIEPIDSGAICRSALGVNTAKYVGRIKATGEVDESFGGITDGSSADSYTVGARREGCRRTLIRSSHP